MNNDEVAKLVADIVNDIFDAMYPESRIDSFKGGLHKTGSLVLAKNRVNYLKRFKNSDYSKWPKKYRERLSNKGETK